MSRKSKIIYFVIAILFFILSDLYITQSIISNGIQVNNNPFFRIVFVENTGAAFNILDGFKSFLIAFSGAAVLAIILYAFKHIMDFTCKYLFLNAMLTAGIFCNMYERLVYGFVRDYISLNFIDFPVFNISDILINTSVFLIVVLIIKNNYIKKNENNS